MAQVRYALHFQVARQSNRAAVCSKRARTVFMEARKGDRTPSNSGTRQWQPIFTVGHSNHAPENFFALLRRHNIKDLIDVRSIPSSGRFPHFKKRSLDALCSQRGISYRHCPELGNKVDGITHLLRQPQGQAALSELAARANQPPTAQGAIAYMCAEADWRDCHRQVIAQQLLEEYGVITSHVLRNGMIELHPPDHELPDCYNMQSAPTRQQDTCCSLHGAKQDSTDDVLSLCKDYATQGTEPTPMQTQADPITCARSVPTRARRWGKKATAP